VIDGVRSCRYVETDDGSDVTTVGCFNKCIGDDTKAAARQSLNCIKSKKIKYGENDFQYGGWNSYTLQCGTIVSPKLGDVYGALG